MKKVCAWCKKELEPDDKSSSNGQISHGICSVCIIKVTGGVPRTANKILDFVREPVFVVNSDGVIKAANSSGLKMVGKVLDEVTNELGGDVFECTYAGEEGGCGNTVHCKTCTIRNTVTDTLATGQGYKNVPAFQSLNTPDGTSVFKFLISTEKVEDSILLRIDSAENVKQAK